MALSRLAGVLLFTLASLGLACAAPSLAQVRTEHLQLHSKAIEGNLQGNSFGRDVYVVLPASYDANPGKRYPVVYYLHGFGDTAKIYVDYIRPDLALGAAGKPADVIIVFPDAYSKLGGSMYASSSTVGDFESFIAEEVVEAVDKAYRTIPRADARGLAGHSMGGAGALRIAMKHPNVFSAIYAMSACCLSARNATDEDRRLEKIKPEDIGKHNFYYATMAAFAPNPANPPLYADLLTKAGVPQELAEARVSANAPTVLVPGHVSALKGMRGIAIDVGNEDWLLGENELLNVELSRFGITHSFTIYPGDHGNRVPERFASHVLPFFSENLSSAP